MPMTNRGINKERLVALFQTLVSIDSPSLDERQMCDFLKERLGTLGIDSWEDGTGKETGSTAGNLYVFVEGEEKLAPILLSAHMDTVEPSRGKRAVIREDGTITSEGTTVLGADDLSGIAVILEVLTVLKEEKRAHRPLEVLFDTAEELYCVGIKRFDFSRLRSKECYVLDLSGPVGAAANQAPSILSFRACFTGKAAHAAFSPEKGIHAIKAAAEAVTNIDCGRVGEATVNVGVIQGGTADNVVPERCLVSGEVRSFDDACAKEMLARIEKTARDAAKKWGATLEFSTKTLCTAYEVSLSCPAALRFQAACGRVGLKAAFQSTYGGSDNNQLVPHGLDGLVIASGMNQCHSCEEYSSVSELAKAAELVLALVLEP